MRVHRAGSFSTSVYVLTRFCWDNSTTGQDLSGRPLAWPTAQAGWKWVCSNKNLYFLTDNLPQADRTDWSLLLHVTPAHPGLYGPTTLPVILSSFSHSFTTISPFKNCQQSLCSSWGDYKRLWIGNDCKTLDITSHYFFPLSALNIKCVFKPLSTPFCAKEHSQSYHKPNIDVYLYPVLVTGIFFLVTS